MPTTGMSRMGRRGRYPVDVPELDTEGLTLYVPPPDRGTVYSTTGQTPAAPTPSAGETALDDLAQPPSAKSGSGGLLNQAQPSQDYLDNMAVYNSDNIGVGSAPSPYHQFIPGQGWTFMPEYDVSPAEQLDNMTGQELTNALKNGWTHQLSADSQAWADALGISVTSAPAYQGSAGGMWDNNNYTNSPEPTPASTTASTTASTPTPNTTPATNPNTATANTTANTATPDTTPPSISIADVNALYNQYLGRDGAAVNLANWANSGMTIEQLANAIANSPEGVAYAAAQAGSDDDTATENDGNTGNVDDDTDDSGTDDDSGWSMSLEQTQQYVTNLYQEILGRAPKQEGLDYWVNSLMSGASAQDVIYNIYQSQEFGGRANSEISNFYMTLTGASGDPSAIAAYVDEAKAQSKTLAQIRDEIYNSDAARAYRASQNNNNNSGSGNVGTGSQGSVNDAVNDTQTYDATTADDSAPATAQDAQVTTRTVSPEELVEYRIQNLLSGDNPYIQRARTSGLQFANQRGLLNSSIAAQAAEEAAIQRAGEIAAQDAATYANAAAANQQAQNTAGLQDAQLGTNVSMFNVGEQNTINRFNAQSINEAGQFNAAAANQAIQNFLQREQVRLLQDDQQAFTAEQNEADRVLRQLLQEQQFDFTSSENALDRSLQSALQANQFAFQGSENALDRDFQGGENAADRALQQLLADKQIAFNTWSQTNQQEWQATQNALQLEFQYYNSNAQVSQSIMYSTMEGIAAIYADPNLTISQKQAAIQNLMNSALSMPGLLDTIQSNNAATQQTFIASNYDDDGVWIGEGYPTWVSPPAEGEEYEQVITPIVNPNTGQTYNAPNAGWTYVGQTSEEQDANPDTATGNYTGDPANLTYIGGNGYLSNLYRDPATGRTYMLVDGQYVPFNPSGGQSGQGGGGGGR